MQLIKHWAATLDDYAIDLAWSPDGSQLAAASAAGPLTLFAATDGAVQHVLPGHDDGTNCLAWRPDGGALATGGQDGQLKLWDPGAGQHTASVKMGNAWVEHLAWRPVAGVAEPGQSSASTWLAVAAGRQLRALRPDGSELHVFKDAPKSISAVVWHPRGGCVAVSYFGGVCLWDADDFIAQKEFPYNNGIQALVWSPDARWLVSGNQDPSVHLWVPEEDMELQMSGYESKVKDLAFDQSSRWLATGGSSECCVWDCSGPGPEGREPAMLPHQTKICATAFQHAHGLLATASVDGVVMLWSPERPKPLRATVQMPAAATKLVWSPDDTMLAIGSEQGVVYVLKCVS
ncbi:MAG: WD40 repeat domain-containing protein [Cephaloticoccus sp.]|nr:WD40 repeat domain-containing protein [Cephaloticoccus sp.]MCF7760987.1 WD40 repeat domain-containing protein [Cephaloticoccus sp.]